MEYIALKHSHMLFVVLSITLFYTRSASRLASGKLAKNKLVFIGSHSVDTLLLISAIAMLVVGSINPLQQPWLIEKIVLVLVYIASGFVIAKSELTSTRIMALLGSTLALLMIGHLAVRKSAFLL